MSNKINILSKFDDLEIQRVAEHFVESLRHQQDGNACILICTNGVYSKTEDHEGEFQIATVVKNPQVAADAIINQAIVMNDLHGMQDLIRHLRQIADCAEQNINYELNRRKTQN